MHFSPFLLFSLFATYTHPAVQLFPVKDNLLTHDPYERSLLSSLEKPSNNSFICKSVRDRVGSGRAGSGPRQLVSMGQNNYCYGA